ncbi:DUF1768-domain-containing protein [Pluteus cervinus]|uniref:DUF1768-domain-containing protein n=1 Tax=Pluteus cervinus TaxID=181527 RepID=A0ACD3AUR5_9AGAR|nr:DUF1768-domain-containing protein [Pluteus cervinus]
MLPALYFQQMGEYSGFLNHSEHRIMYRNKTYPSAAHLWEAMKYLDRRPDLAEMIRMCADFGELFQLTSSEAFRKEERRDWAKVFLKVLEDVVLRKFRQHPDLRSLLLGTGHAPLVYSDTRDGYWGDGPMGSGTNHLGKVLQVVRDRLRNEREPHA